MFGLVRVARLGFISFVLFLFSSNGFCVNQSLKASVDLFSLSLQELMNVKIETGSLTENTLFNSPSAITIITQNQIQSTPARSIMDLLETYVPGLLLTIDNATGPNIRIRGLGERHFHTLLMVNGKPINQKAYQGSMVELRNWDMGDIDSIEIARGLGQ